MIELFKMMNSNTITIKGDGIEATLTKTGPLVVFDIVSDWRVTDEEIKSAFGLPDGVAPPTMLICGPRRRSRGSWVLGEQMALPV